MEPQILKPGQDVFTAEHVNGEWCIVWQRMGLPPLRASFGTDDFGQECAEREAENLNAGKTEPSDWGWCDTENHVHVFD